MSDESLDDLPRVPAAYERSPCMDCGSYDWIHCNTHPEGGVHQCNDCCEWSEELNCMVRKNLQ